MKTLYRVAHALLVVVLFTLLVRAVSYTFSLLWVEQHSQHRPEETEIMTSQKPSPQEIVCRASNYSMNARG